MKAFFIKEYHSPAVSGLMFESCGEEESISGEMLRTSLCGLDRIYLYIKKLNCI